MGLGVLVIIAGLIIFLFYIPSLRITKVAIAGLGSVDEKNLRAEVLAALDSRRFLVLPRDHLLFFPKNEVEELLNHKFRVRTFELSKDFPSSISIQINARETWAVWCPASGRVDCLLLDKDGLGFEKARDFAGTAVLKIIDARDDDFLGKKILEHDKLIKLQEMISDIPGKAGDELSTINIKASGETYLLYLRSGWYLLIDEDIDPRTALENLTIVLKSEIKEKKNDLEYIDLRFRDKVFYKFKNAESVEEPPTEYSI